MIQWFPGHMAKAKNEIQSNLKLVDIVFELVDARAPLSSRNPMIHEIVKGKPTLVIMTKADLSSFEQNNIWLRYFEKDPGNVILVDSISGFHINKIATKAREILKDKLEKEKSKGMKERPIRCMIVGIPNVGKSTLINRIVQKKVTLVGNKPGVTKAQQWIRMNKHLELLDTPGVLWPKFEDPIAALHLAILGSIKDQILPIEDVVEYLIHFLMKNHPEELKKRYQVEKDAEIKDVYDLVSKSTGISTLATDGYSRIAETILHDFRMLRFGRITLDRIPNEERTSDE